jgi:hypothetical protein
VDQVKTKKPSSCAIDFSVIMISKKNVYDKIHDHRWNFLSLSDLQKFYAMNRNVSLKICGDGATVVVFI